MIEGPTIKMRMERIYWNKLKKQNKTKQNKKKQKKNKQTNRQTKTKDEFNVEQSLNYHAQWYWILKCESTSGC